MFCIPIIKIIIVKGHEISAGIAIITFKSRKNASINKIFRHPTRFLPIEDDRIYISLY